MDILIPQNIRAVLERLEQCGYEAYIVGGCVRDSLMGLAPKDYDITTNASPDETVNCFKDTHRVIETGIKHGTVTVVSDGENVEITTYRVDGSYSDHRRPDSVSFSSRLEDDLSRRDFTVNAMAYNTKNGLADLFGGRKDLEAKIIRCVGDPFKRFNEDALRIMRALRFSSRLGFSIHEDTARAMHECRELLKEISTERILSELTLFLMGAAPCALMTEFADIFGVIVPEVIPCIGFEQKTDYHIYDVWEHTARAVENAPAEKYVRTALFFHDLGKPTCFYEDEKGKGHFKGHEALGASMARDILKRMHSDNLTVKNTELLIRYHDTDPTTELPAVRRLAGTLGFENLFRLTEVMKADNSAKHPRCLERVAALERMEETAREIQRRGDCCTQAGLAVTGNDLISLGIRGKAVGNILSELLELVIEEELPNEREALKDKAMNLFSDRK